MTAYRDFKFLSINQSYVIPDSIKKNGLFTKVEHAYMVWNILNNQEWYRRIPEIFLERMTKEYRNLITEAYLKGIIDKKTLEFLNIKTPKTPTLYALPKIHKSLIQPPGRPIVSGIGCLTESASQLVDDYLRPYVNALSSHIQDTGDLICTLDGIDVPEGAWLVTLDVEALYNSIPHDRG